MKGALSFDLVMGSIGIGLVAVMILSVLSMRDVDWLQEAQYDMMVFRYPFIKRAAFVAMGLWILVSPLLLASQASDGLLRYSVIIIGGCIFGIGFISAGTRQYILRLDLERRTYQLTYGWSFRQQIILGPWQDFTGVFVRWVSMKGHDAVYFVGLEWHCNGRSRPYLGRFKQSERAEALALQIAQILNVPVVPAPARDMFLGDMLW